MVSKNVTLLSFFMPIAMVLGTTIAIEFYKYSSSILLILAAFGGVMLCTYVIVLWSEKFRTVR
jgi:Ca2+/H+ antiporter